MQKSADAFRTISEVADDLSLPQHVLRFWETRFPQIRPLKRAGGRRYYRPTDVSLLRAIRQLLYDDGYTIKGVQRLLKEQGARELGTRAAGVADLPLDHLSDPADENFAGAEEPGDISEASVLDPHPGDQMPRIEDGPVVHAATSTLSQRDLILDALKTVEDCRRILDALSAPER